MIHSQEDLISTNLDAGDPPCRVGAAARVHCQSPLIARHHCGSPK